jgi:hypothetical protein
VGNVGIGTTAPLTNLSVNGNGLTSFTGTPFGQINVQIPFIANNYSAIDFHHTGLSGQNYPVARIGVKHTGGGTFMQFGTSNIYASGITNIAMTIDPVANVGIGTAAPQAKLDVFGFGSTNLKIRGSGQGFTNAFINLVATTDANARGTGMIMADSVSGTQWFAGRPYAGGFTNNDVFAIQRKNSYAVADDASAYYNGSGAFNASNFLTITNNGYVGIGLSNPQGPLDITPGSYSGTPFIGTATKDGMFVGGGAGDRYVSMQRSIDGGYVLHLTKNNATGGGLLYFSIGGTYVGGVAATATTVAYNIASDKRLKENIVPKQNALSIVNAIKVYDYTFKKDPKKMVHCGFMAQELYEVYPQAVTQGDVDSIGQPWGVDYSKLTPILTKSIQELEEIVETQNEKILALEKQKQEIDKIKKENQDLKTRLSEIEILINQLNVKPEILDNTKAKLH